MKSLVSVIIVHYKVKEDLFDCLSSIYSFKPRVSFEIIVVDNDEKNTTEKELKERFKEVLYIKTKQNIGFGAGNNLGAKKARGDYLFFLNPDTKVFEGAIDTLFKFISEKKDTAAVAPLLVGKNNNPYPLQGSKELTPVRAIFAHSFINRLFPKNPIARKFWLLERDKKSIKEAEVLPGTAFLIRRDIFRKVGGFDENIFLFFEENDLFNKIKKLGFKNYIISDSRVFHAWGMSTKKREDIDKIFQKSRFYYFKKWYGFIPAIAVEIVASFNIANLFLVFILSLSLFLRVYKLNQLMIFIGDQGWFYLSARDMLLTGKIPLVGIPSSHPWLHQGAYWTYLLAGALKLGNFSPLSGGILAAVFGILTAYFLYFIGKKMFSETVGLIAAAFYAASPFAIIQSRMPYHTSPIPFFTILYIYSLYKWLGGEKKYFPISIALVAILYNFEISTYVLAIPLLIFFLYGAYRKKLWVRALFSREIIIWSLLAFFLPMLPMIIYDLSHGFPQTFKFIAWFGYRVLVLIGLYPSLHPGIPQATLSDFFSLSLGWLTRLIFAQSAIIALIVFFLSISYFGLRLYKEYKSKKVSKASVIIALWMLFGIGAYLINHVPSEAYLPMFFPGIIILIALFFEKFISIKRIQILAVGVFCALLFFNARYFISRNYFMGPSGLYGPTFSDRVSVAKEILKESDGKKYNIMGRGPGSRFKSFTMNYEYLTWWLGHGPSKKEVPLKFIITEASGNISVEKKIEK